MRKKELDQECPKCSGTLIQKEAVSIDYVLVYCKNCDFTQEKSDRP